MKLPESTATDPLGRQQVVQRDRERRAGRSAPGRRRSSIRHVAPAHLGARCARRSAVGRGSRGPAAAAELGGTPGRRRPTSPSTPRSTGRLAPSASGSRSTCTTVASGADQPAVPGRPHVQRAAPADDEVGAADQLGGERRGEPAGDAERPRVPANRPVGHRRGGQQRPAAARPALERPPAPASRAPRPARNTGRRAAASSVGQLGDRGGGRPGGAGSGSTGAAGTGQLRRPAPPGRPAAGSARTVRRSPTARAVGPRRRRRPRSRPVQPLGTAPTARGQAVLVDPEVRAHRGAAVSAASTSSGVRLLAASVMPVIALVSPGPGAPYSTPTSPADPGVRVGHRRRAALVPGRDEAGAGRDQRVGDGEVAAADHAEDVVGAELGQRPRRPPRRRARPAVSARPARGPAPGCPSRRRSAAARRSARRRWAAARPGCAAGSGRTCRRRAGTSGTGTAGRS